MAASRARLTYRRFRPAMQNRTHRACARCAASRTAAAPILRRWRPVCRMRAWGQTRRGRAFRTRSPAGTIRSPPPISGRGARFSATVPLILLLSIGSAMPNFVLRNYLYYSGRFARCQAEFAACTGIIFVCSAMSNFMRTRRSNDKNAAPFCWGCVWNRMIIQRGR